MTHEYEITYLSDPQFTDEKRGELDASVDAVIAERGGSISNSLPSIRRRLAYMIGKNTAAFSRTVNVQLDPSQLEELRKVLRKKDGVLRLYVINTPLRTSVTVDMLTKASERDSKDKVPKKEEKPVTMQDVEAGIEEALQEEVK